MRKSRWIPMLVSIFLLMFSLTAFAFEDVSDEAGKDAILDLYNKGYVNGVSKTKFAPHRSLSYAEAVTLYVKVFDLNLDHIRFIKQPLASDSYDKIKDDAWYADAFVIAYHHGVAFPRDINPMSAISKEEFAHYLYEILTSKVDVVTIKILHHYADMDQVNTDYRSSINDLISLKIVTLNKDNQFQPKKAISRAEAAVMLHQVLQQYGEDFTNPVVIMPKPPEAKEEIQVFTEKLTDEVNKVTLYWGEMPNPGYGISIDNIEFDNIEFDAQVATIYYTLHTPDPNMMYPMVITPAKATTYVDAKYEVKAFQSKPITLPYETPKVKIPVINPDMK